MAKRKSKLAAFIGKTLADVDTRSVNYWVFKFTDGTEVGIEVESMGLGLMGLVVHPIPYVPNSPPEKKPRR